MIKCLFAYSLKRCAILRSLKYQSPGRMIHAFPKIRYKVDSFPILWKSAYLHTNLNVTEKNCSSKMFHINVQGLFKAHLFVHTFWNFTTEDSISHRQQLINMQKEITEKWKYFTLESLQGVFFFFFLTTIFFILFILLFLCQ